MKRLFLIVLFSLIPSFGLAYFDSDVSFGMKGDQIVALQEFLAEQDVYSGPITGNFFSLTLKGVKTFQAREGISSTGYFGPITRARANEILSLQGVGESIATETGTTTQNTTPTATLYDLLQKQLEQLIILKNQLEALQQQQNTLNQIQTQQVQQQTVLVQQQQTLGAIQENTTPIFAPLPETPPASVPVAPQPSYEVKISASNIVHLVLKNPTTSPVKYTSLTAKVWRKEIVIPHERTAIEFYADTNDTILNPNYFITPNIGTSADTATTIQIPFAKDLIIGADRDKIARIEIHSVIDGDPGQYVKNQYFMEIVGFNL